MPTFGVVTNAAEASLPRLIAIGTISFLTLVDLFAAQAIVPSLTVAYQVTAVRMGVAVNSCTAGMAVAGLVVAALSRRIDRGRGVHVSLLLVYLVFLPSLGTPPLAGWTQSRIGTRTTVWLFLGVAVAGLPLTLLANLPSVLVGLTFVAIGTFFAQAATTGVVSGHASGDRGSASGLYLASYYLGGLTGSAVLGVAYGRYGWEGRVEGVAVSLILAGVLAARLIPARSKQSEVQSRDFGTQENVP
jgi:predicted MFS family arabinose efflux permease